MERASGTGTGNEDLFDTASIGGSRSTSADESRQQSESGMMSDLGDKAAAFTDKAPTGASAVKEKATAGTDTVIDKAAGGLDSLASAVRGRSESMGDGQVQSIADSAAGTLAAGAEMLRGQNTDQLISELEDLVRRKPLESLLVAAGVGYVLSRAL